MHLAGEGSLDLASQWWCQTFPKRTDQRGRDPQPSLGLLVGQERDHGWVASDNSRSEGIQGRGCSPPCIDGQRPLILHEDCGYPGRPRGRKDRVVIAVELTDTCRVAVACGIEARMRPRKGDQLGQSRLLASQNGGRPAARRSPGVPGDRPESCYGRMTAVTNQMSSSIPISPAMPSGVASRANRRQSCWRR
jgi:hypothetical protein